MVLRRVASLLLAASVGTLPSPTFAATVNLPSAGIERGGAAPVATYGLQLVKGTSQARPTSEEEAQAFSDAWELAEKNPDDFGYPWIDPTTRTLVLRSVSARGAALVTDETVAFAMASTAIEASRSFNDLESIKHEAISLRAEGIPDGDLIFKTAPDHEGNRVVITVSIASDRLFKALADRYGTDAIAIQIDPTGPGGSPATRDHDGNPYWGGARIGTPGKVCSDSFPWHIASSTGNALLTAAHCIASGGSVTINGSTVGSVTATSEENWSTVYGSRFYTGQTVYRGDVALIRLSSSFSAGTRIYRGNSTSSTSSPVVLKLGRYSQLDEQVYVGGQATGETGPYKVEDTEVDWWYSQDGPNVIVRNVVQASIFFGGSFCADHGDSGGSVFKSQPNGVIAYGTYSGFQITNCRIMYTDIHRSYMGLPGDVNLAP